MVISSAGFLVGLLLLGNGERKNVLFVPSAIRRGAGGFFPFLFKP